MIKPVCHLWRLTENELWLAISTLWAILHINGTHFHQLGIWQWQLTPLSATLECLFLCLDCNGPFTSMGRREEKTAFIAWGEKLKLSVRDYFGFQDLTCTAVISLEGLRPRLTPTSNLPPSYCRLGCIMYPVIYCFSIECRSNGAPEPRT